jgi:hypothetical protein
MEPVVNGGHGYPLNIRCDAHTRTCREVSKSRVIVSGGGNRSGSGDWLERERSRAVVRFYNKRGTAEQRIKESEQAVAMTRLSCHRFRANEVRLWLSLIAYNRGDLWRRLAQPTRVASC